MAKRKNNSDNDLSKLLPTVTAEKYSIVKIGKRQSTHFYHPKYGEVNFRTLSVARAAQLVKSGAPFIELKPKTEEPSN